MIASLVAEMARPPLVVRGSLDIALDSTHTPLAITSIPIEAVVGMAKLLAPGAFQVSLDIAHCIICY